jgi:hypothetical protein
LLTVPGIVVLGCSGTRAVSRFRSAILADLAIRGCAISSFTLARVVSLGTFLCRMHSSWRRAGSHKVPFRTLRILFFRKFGFEVAFNIFTAQWVSGSGQYDRIDDLVPCKLRCHEGPIFRQFLVDEFHFSAVCKCLNPVFILHFSVSSAGGQWCEYTPRIVRTRERCLRGLLESPNCTRNCLYTDRSPTCQAVSPAKGCITLS